MPNSPLTLTLAVSGLGSIGTQHLKIVIGRPDVRVVVFDPDPEFRARACQLSSAIRAVATFEELLDAGPDGLIVAAPDEVHLLQLLAAHARGIPVLVEKPIAPTLNEAASAVKEISADGAAVLVGYVLRHRRAVQLVREMIQQGDIGRPVSCQVMLGAYGTIVAASSRFSHPADNRLYRDYSHEWDYLRWFFGPAEEVMATARTVDDVEHVEVPNCADGMLRFEGGLIAGFHLDYLEPVGTRTVHVLGTKGSLFANLATGLVTTRSGGRNHEKAYNYSESSQVVLANQIHHLVDIIQRGATPMVTLDDGLAALAVAEGVQQSAASNRWTKIPTWR